MKKPMVHDKPDQLLEEAKQAASRVFKDTSVSADKTLERLEDLTEYIEEMISSIVGDERPTWRDFET